MLPSIQDNLMNSLPRGKQLPFYVSATLHNGLCRRIRCHHKILEIFQLWRGIHLTDHHHKILCKPYSILKENIRVELTLCSKQDCFNNEK